MKQLTELHSESLRVTDDRQGYRLLYNLVRILKEKCILSESDCYLINDILMRLDYRNIYFYQQEKELPIIVSDCKSLMALSFLVGICFMFIVELII